MKVLVVDDHPLVRDAMSGILAGFSSALEIIEASDCAAGLAIARAHPDLGLVLLDLELPGSRGFDALDRFRREHPTLPVVILSMHRDRHAVRGAIERGAMGFIPKASPKEVIAGAVRLVLSGGVYLPPEALAEADGDAVAGAFPPHAGTRSLADLGLTPRQGQVLALIMQGKSNKEICRDLGLADRTVKVHVTAVLNALRVPSRAKAVVAAGKLGLSADALLARAPDPSPDARRSSGNGRRRFAALRPQMLQERAQPCRLERLVQQVQARALHGLPDLDRDVAAHDDRRDVRPARRRTRRITSVPSSSFASR